MSISVAKFPGGKGSIQFSSNTLGCGNLLEQNSFWSCILWKSQSPRGHLASCIVNGIHTTSSGSLDYNRVSPKNKIRETIDPTPLFPAKTRMQGRKIPPNKSAHPSNAWRLFPEPARPSSDTPQLLSCRLLALCICSWVITPSVQCNRKCGDRSAEF